MELLRFLESIRQPALSALLAAWTYLGDVTAFLALCVTVTWCFDKQMGYYMLSSGMSGSIVSEFLKIVCRVPRPWVLDENFTIVEKARAAATGYSFPSGHSVNAVATFGGIAMWTKKTWLRVVCIIIALGVCFSRMYLGVHTPWDVLAGACIGVIIIIILRRAMIKRDVNVNRRVFLIMLALAAANLIFVQVCHFPQDVDAANLASAVKNAWTLLGCAIALPIAHEIDVRKVRYDTKAVWWAQIIKTVLGLALVLALRAGLKAVFGKLFGDALWPECLRYAIMTLFALGVWPMTFKHFAKLGR